MGVSEGALRSRQRAAPGGLLEAALILPTRPTPRPSPGGAEGPARSPRDLGRGGGGFWLALSPHLHPDLTSVPPPSSSPTPVPNLPQSASAPPPGPCPAPTSWARSAPRLLRASVSLPAQKGPQSSSRGCRRRRDWGRVS